MLKNVIISGQSSGTVSVWISPGGSYTKLPSSAVQSCSRYFQRPLITYPMTSIGCRCRDRMPLLRTRNRLHQPPETVLRSRGRNQTSFACGTQTRSSSGTAVPAISGRIPAVGRKSGSLICLSLGLGFDGPGQRSDFGGFVEFFRKIAVRLAIPVPRVGDVALLHV